MGDPERPLAEPQAFQSEMKYVNDSMYRIPTLSEMGVDESTCGPKKFAGGETEALKRFKSSLSNETWVANFEKPNTAPNR